MLVSKFAYMDYNKYKYYKVYTIDIRGKRNENIKKFEL